MYRIRITFFLYHIIIYKKITILFKTLKNILLRVHRTCVHVCAHVLQFYNKDSLGSYVF